MTERERLARIFGIEPLRPWGAVAIAAAMGLWPPLLVGSAAIALALGAIFDTERRKLREGLAEVERWGFPVTGYRGWLLAREPAFDLELRREVGIELLEGSITAVDSTIRVEARGDRVARVIMRRVEVRSGERTQTFLAGDRARLAELGDRVLAPLHADVGITAMRMGEAETLAAVVAAPVAAGTHGAAFREQAMVAPPDLQSLVVAGRSQLVPPNEARSLKLRTDRLLFATGQEPMDTKWVAYVMLVGAIVGLVIAAPVGGVLGVIGGGVAGWALRQGDHQKLHRALNQTHWPFRVEGYADWLLSGRPICDIEFSSPPDRAAFERALRSVARVAELTWLDDTHLRIESQSVLHSGGQGIPSFWGGDPRELNLVGRRVLVPLHEVNPIVAVRMGGYLDRRV